MMRPTMRALISVPLATATLTLLTMSGARAGLVTRIAAPNTGIVVGGGTVQPIGDPHGLFTFNVSFNMPVSGESIQDGDYFIVTSTTPGLLFNKGSNEQPTDPEWTVSWPGDPVVPKSTKPKHEAEFSSVKWTFEGLSPITSGGSLNPSNPTANNPPFQVTSPFYGSGSFTYTFHDSITSLNAKGKLVTTNNEGEGSFTIATPEPSTLVMVGSAMPLGLYLRRQVRRRQAVA